MKLHLARDRHFTQDRSHLRIAQHGRLSKIAGNILSRQRDFLSLKQQRNLPDFLLISLQPFFSNLATIRSEMLRNRVTGALIDLVQDSE